jgi:hypothetical protein
VPSITIKIWELGALFRKKELTGDYPVFDWLGAGLSP